MQTHRCAHEGSNQDSHLPTEGQCHLYAVWLDISYALIGTFQISRNLCNAMSELLQYTHILELQQGRDCPKDDNPCKLYVSKY